MQKSLNKLKIRKGFRVRLATNKDANGKSLRDYGIDQYAVGIIQSIKNNLVVVLFNDRENNFKQVKLKNNQILLLDDMRIGF